MIPNVKEVELPAPIRTVPAPSIIPPPVIKSTTVSGLGNNSLMSIGPQSFVLIVCFDFTVVPINILLEEKLLSENMMQS